MNKIKNFINDENYKIYIYDNYIYIYKYGSIKNFSNNQIQLTVKNKDYWIIGMNITIKKLTKEEVLISGKLK